MFDDNTTITAHAHYAVDDEDTFLELCRSLPICSGDYYLNGNALVVRPQSPDFYYCWDWDNNVWMDPRTLDQMKAAQWQVIKAARLADLTSPLVTPYGTFDCTITDQTNITNAVALLQTLESLGTPQTVNFTLADNTIAMLNTARMVRVGLALGAKSQAAYDKAREKRLLIFSSTTAAGVQAVTWESTP